MTDRFWYGLVTFAMGLTLPEEEVPLSKKLGTPFWVALVLTNDLYSWEKERDDAARAGQSQVMNAIWVLMQEHSMTEVEAQAHCRKLIKENVSNAAQIVKQTKDDTSLSLDLRQYIEALMYSVKGNLVWSIYCPRYHSDEP
jgi:hypothetical protein